jgi:hypothetical protein
VPADYLHIIPGTSGYEIGAGLFKPGSNKISTSGMVNLSFPVALKYLVLEIAIICH